MNTCRCSRPVATPASTVCRTCLDDLQHALFEAPAWAEQLAVTIARQGVEGDPVRRSSRSTPLPFDYDASLVLERLSSTLVGRARWHSTPTSPSPYSPRRAGAWLRAHLDLVETSDEGPATVQEVIDAVEAARRACDPHRPDETYLGPCDQCRIPLLAKPGAAFVGCSGCGATYDVARRRRDLLRAAEDVLVPAHDLARALTRLGQPVTPERIRKWAERSRLPVKGHEPVRSTGARPVPLYRVGDALDLLAADARRAGHAA